MRWLLALLFLLVPLHAAAFEGFPGKSYRFHGFFCNEVPGVEHLISSANWRGTLREDTIIPPSCTFAAEVRAKFLGVEQVVVAGHTKYMILKVEIDSMHPYFYLRLFELPLVQYLFYFDPDYVGV